MPVSRLSPCKPCNLSQRNGLRSWRQFDRNLRNKPLTTAGERQNMKWEGNRESDNVEDRRNGGGGGFRGGGGRGLGPLGALLSGRLGWAPS